MKLILYHDICEIYAKDTHSLKRNKKTTEKENKAIQKLSKKIPLTLSKEILKYHNEYVKQKTREAKFVKIIDVLDPAINEITQPKQWKKFGYTEELFRKTKEKHINNFLELKKFFEDIIKSFRKKGLFAKK